MGRVGERSRPSPRAASGLICALMPASSINVQSKDAAWLSQVPRAAGVPPTTMAVSLVEAEMLALCLGLFLNGIYIVTLGIAGRVLLTNPEGRLRSAREINWVLLTVFVALFLNDTMDTVLEIVQAMNAFALYTGPGRAEHVFLRGSSSITLAKVKFLSLFDERAADEQSPDCLCWSPDSYGRRDLGKTLSAVLNLTELFLEIWRCWFIWKSKTWLVIVLPVIAWIANFVLNAYVDVLLSRVFQGLVFSSAIQPWGEAFWIIAICINTFTTGLLSLDSESSVEYKQTTGLIVFQLWEVESTNVQFREPSSMNTSFSDRTKTLLGRAMRNIVESGMLITVSSLLMCIAYSTQSNFNYPANSYLRLSFQAFHSVGIAFNLIIIRGAKRRSRVQNQTGAASIHFSTNPMALGSTRAEIHTTTTVITDANLKQERFSLAPMAKRSASVDNLRRAINLPRAAVVGDNETNWSNSSRDPPPWSTSVRTKAAAIIVATAADGMSTVLTAVFTALHAFGWPGHHPRPTASAEERCLALKESMCLENTTILNVTYISGPTTVDTPGSCVSTTPVSEALCRVYFVTNTTSTSAVHAEAWLPDVWYGRFLGLGNAQVGGCIDYADLDYGASLSFATVGTDNGHDGNTGLPFLNHPEVINDFAWRAVHTEVVIGKQLVEAYYGRPMRARL
uniref:Carboxylic ester hydrolase n=1 Tax=Mycena chlorophos TaxID=658473 RepID=A0ABQ0L2J1_MYCCL|nr:predicted protein [Mycena chlorophos]